MHKNCKELFQGDGGTVNFRGGLERAVKHWLEKIGEMLDEVMNAVAKEAQKFVKSKGEEMVRRAEHL